METGPARIEPPTPSLGDEPPKSPEDPLTPSVSAEDRDREFVPQIVPHALRAPDARGPQCLRNRATEGAGLEPARACARRFSRPVPYHSASPPKRSNLAATPRFGQRVVAGGSGGRVYPMLGVFLKIESARTSARVASCGLLVRNTSAS